MWAWFDIEIYLFAYVNFLPAPRHTRDIVYIRQRGCLVLILLDRNRTSVTCALIFDILKKYSYYLI